MFQKYADIPAVIAVLDIETALDPVAVALIGGGRSGLASRSALHRVRSAAILTARRRADRVVVDLRSRNIDQMPEDDLLSSLDADLLALSAEGATLVTFNGRRHDLPILRRRLMRYMMFGTRGLARWSSDEAAHIDLMTDLPTSGIRWGSLQDEAAGLGIAMPMVPPQRNAAATALQCEVDCAVTYLLYLHAISCAASGSTPLLDGWRGLATAIEKEPGRLSHLTPLRKPAGLPTPL